jgi:hypothetical protein
MINVSEMFKDFASSPGCWVKARARVGDKIAENAWVNVDIWDYHNHIIDINIFPDRVTGFEIGRALCRRLEITLRNVIEVKKETRLIIEVQFLKDETLTEWHELGWFFVDDVTLIENRDTFIIAFDNMKLLERDFDSRLEYPARTADVIEEICSRFGGIITNPKLRLLNDDYIVVKPTVGAERAAGSVELLVLKQYLGGIIELSEEQLLLLDFNGDGVVDVNDLLVLLQNLKASEFGDIIQDELYTAREVLAFIATMCGGCIFFDNYNELSCTTFEDTGEIVHRKNIFDLKKLDFVFEVKNINWNQIGSFLPETDDNFGVISFSNNLIIGNTREMLESIANKLIGIKYQPITVEKQGFGYYEPGDVIHIEGENVPFIITGIQYKFENAGFTETIQSAAAGRGTSNSISRRSQSRNHSIIGENAVNTPNLIRDFNATSIKVEQHEKVIAEIDIDVTRADDAFGRFDVSCFSFKDTQAEFRVYANGIEHIKSPWFMQLIHGHDNTFGIPHTYFNLLSGENIITLTMSIDDGYAIIGARQVEHSINVFASDSEELKENIYDLTVAQPNGQKTTAKVYTISKINHNENDYPVTSYSKLSINHIYRKRDFEIKKVYENAANALDLAIECNGYFEDGQLITTDDWVFFITTDEELWAQRGSDDETQTLLAQNCTRVSACRGWNEKQDAGFIVSYIKRNGLVYYRQLFGENSVEWDEEHVLDEASGAFNTSVHVCRLSETRIGFAVSGIDKLFVTDRHDHSLPPGEEWETVTLAAGFNFSIAKICYGNGVYVAIARRETLVAPITRTLVALVSRDGQNWTVHEITPPQQTVPATTNALLFDGERFVAVFNNITRFSSDGRTWTSQVNNIGIFVERAVYGKEKYIAVGGDIIRTSDDAITWRTTYTNPNGNMANVLSYGGDKFAAAQNNTGTFPNNRSVSSIDGDVWTLSPIQDLTNNILNIMEYGNNRFVAVTNGNHVFTREDNADRFTRDMDANLTGLQARDLVFGRLWFMAIGGGNVLYISTDSEHWIPRTPPAFLVGGCFGGGKFVFFGSAPTGNGHAIFLTG